MIQIMTLALKRNFKNIPITAVLIFFPILLMFILGNSLEEMQKTGVTFAENVAVYNRLTGEDGGALNELLTNEEFESIFVITDVTSEEEGMKGLNEGDYTSLIIAESTEDNVTLRLVTSNENTPLAAILRTFAEDANLYMLATQKGFEPMNINDSGSSLMKMQDDKGSPEGIHYFAIQCLLQSIVLGGLFGVFSVMEDYDKNTYLRYKVSPISRRKTMIGRMIANVIYLSCITVFIILGSILFLKANWQGNSLVIGITILLMSLIVNGIGMLLGTATKSTGLSIGLLVGFMMIWSKASGSFNPEPSKSVFAVLSPNFNAKNIFYATIYGGSTDMILKSIGFMGLIALLIYLLFFILEGRRKHERI